MAAHSKPRQRRTFGGGTARTAATLALAGAATATAFDGTGHAAPRLSPAQVKAKVDKLYHEAEIATEKYDGAKEKADKSSARLGHLRDEAARRTARLNTAREALGSIATAQYRTGAVDPAVQVALSSDPDDFLDRAAVAERAGGRQATTIGQVRGQLAGIGRLRAAADGELDRLKSRKAELKRQKTTVTGKLAEAKRLLARLTAAQRAEMHAGPAADGEPGGAGTTAARASRAAGRHLLPSTAPGKAPNSRAAAAVSYAYKALGSPYVWGATGPNAFDCSGLTQAAYRAAGVSLPRTTYAQINAGTRVSRSQLRPGDLVFFYSGISHVGLYIGDGKMIHAPNPSAPVRVAPVSQMPFAGAARVA